MIGLDLLGAGNDSYEHAAYKDGRRYFGASPNATGSRTADGVFQVDVPGWHFATYDEWFRFGYNDAQAGRPSMIGSAAFDASVVRMQTRGAQDALKAAGFDPGASDGVMGPKTAAAITAYWATKGVSRAPIVDADLLRALNVSVSSGGFSPDKAPAPRSASGASAPPEAPLEEGDAEKVATKRKRLYLIGGAVATVVVGGIVYAIGSKTP